MMDQTDEMAARDTEQAKAAGMEAVAQAIPDADEPLEPEVVNTAWGIVGPAIERLSGDQIRPEPYAEVTEPQARVPPELGTKILAIGGLVKEVPGLEGYDFDPVAALRTNDGLTEAALAIDEMSRDKAVLKALKQPIPAADAGGEEPEPESEDPTEEE
jgi:hypothetical protein